MKGIKKSPTVESLYLEYSHQAEGGIFPLHTSVALFLLSYCDCKVFNVYLVLTEENLDTSLLREALSQDLDIQVISRQALPPIVQNCCLPAVVEQPEVFCRAGLAVVLRHVIQKSYEAEPSRKEILELLGFKKTCLKACAEVSQWTRLCELTIPLAVENFLQESSDQSPAIPEEILQLERKLSEPVRVHNDDKLRRQKLKQQKTAGVEPSSGKGKAKGKARAQQPSKELAGSSKSLELMVAFSKLTVQDTGAANKEPPHIRKAKASDLPPLEHVFAEGLYFTLADIVLLPCVHQFLVIISKKFSEKLEQFPLLTSWYQRIQQVPKVKTAAAKCGIHFLYLPELLNSESKPHLNPDEVTSVEEPSDPLFIGGPRPTMTKLMETGIEALFSPHPCPSWTLDWNSLPAAVSPKEASDFPFVGCTYAITMVRMGPVSGPAFQCLGTATEPPLLAGAYAPQIPGLLHPRDQAIENLFLALCSSAWGLPLSFPSRQKPTHPIFLDFFSTHGTRTRTRKRRITRVLDLLACTERELWSPNHQARKRIFLYLLEDGMGRRYYKNTLNNRKQI